MADGPANRRGRLLVAAPALVDPNFHRTVVLMLEHNEEGALGLVLNRPSELIAAEAIPGDLGLALEDHGVVFRGGPVQPEAVIIVADFTDPGAAASMVFGTVGIVDPEADATDLAGAVRSIRAFGGYAGWSAGQLEREIEEEAWIDAGPVVEDVFTDEPETLWNRVLDRKGGTWRLIARIPPDPTLN